MFIIGDSWRQQGIVHYCNISAAVSAYIAAHWAVLRIGTNSFGPALKWFRIFTDVHDRKLLKLDLSARTAQLLRSNERMNRFAYAVSHDLLEPLRMIGSYTQLLARRNTGRLDNDSDQFIRFILTFLQFSIEAAATRDPGAKITFDKRRRSRQIRIC